MGAGASHGYNSIEEALADGAPDCGPIVEGERPEGRATDVARVFVCSCQVESAGTDDTDRFAGDRIGDGSVTRARVPAPCYVALERAHNQSLRWSI